VRADSDGADGSCSSGDWSAVTTTRTVGSASSEFVAAGFTSAGDATAEGAGGGRCSSAATGVDDCSSWCVCVGVCSTSGGCAFCGSRVFVCGFSCWLRGFGCCSGSWRVAVALAHTPIDCAAGSRLDPRLDTGVHRHTRVRRCGSNCAAAADLEAADREHKVQVQTRSRSNSKRQAIWSWPAT
jgi:hypothetical protein